MRALITGAGGFCGRHLVAYLEGRGVEVHSVGTRELPRPRHHRIDDTGDREALMAVIGTVRPDAVFHLAGVRAANNVGEFYRINAEYAIALLGALAHAGFGQQPVLLLGTAAEYGVFRTEDLPLREELCPQPYDHYGISKLAQTLEALAAHRRTNSAVVVVRAFNLIGPGMPADLALQSFALQLARIRRGTAEPVIETGNLGSVRDFVAIGEAVSLLWDLARTPKAIGQVVNLCSGTGTAVSDLLGEMIAISGLPVTVKTVAERTKPLDIPVHYGSPEKLVSLVGRRPGAELEGTLRAILEEAWNS